MKKIAKGGAANKMEEGTVGNAGNEDVRHWTRFSRPVTGKGMDLLSESYDREKFTREGDLSLCETAAVTLMECYRKLGESTFDNVMANYLGLYQLIKHNPHFQAEAHAMRMMIEGETVMNQFCQKVENL